MAHLARYTGGDSALNAEVLRLFDTQANELVARLRSILDARDQKSWKEITHTLKGAARGIGAFGFADAAAIAEPLDLAGQPAEAGRALADLNASAQAVQAFIRAYLRR
ncbi:MAG TPA: Hpt domain-containing protein [Rhizomicrobium sp.]|nr:Hpt domain-containing protein [Rhizomicrobium sp.]